MVSVPGGARDGQVLHLEGYGEASPDAGEAGSLILTIHVVAAQAASPFSPANTPEAEETLLTAEPTILATMNPAAHVEPSTPTRTEVTPTEIATSAGQGLFPPAPIPLSIGTTLYTYHGHSDSVYAVAWSPGGRRIASGGYDNTIQVWDAVDGGHVYTYHGHSSFVKRVAWSPDGRRIASGSDDKTVQVWLARV